MIPKIWPKVNGASTANLTLCVINARFAAQKPHIVRGTFVCTTQLPRWAGQRDAARGGRALARFWRDLARGRRDTARGGRDVSRVPSRFATMGGLAPVVELEPAGDGLVADGDGEQDVLAPPVAVRVAGGVQVVEKRDLRIAGLDVTQLVEDGYRLAVLHQLLFTETTAFYSTDFNMALTSSMLGCRHFSQSSSDMVYSKYSHSGDGAYSDFTQ